MTTLDDIYSLINDLNAASGPINLAFEIIPVDQLPLIEIKLQEKFNEISKIQPNAAILPHLQFLISQCQPVLQPLYPDMPTTEIKQNEAGKAWLSWIEILACGESDTPRPDTSNLTIEDCNQIINSLISFHTVERKIFSIQKYSKNIMALLAGIQQGYDQGKFSSEQIIKLFSLTHNNGLSLLKKLLLLNVPTMRLSYNLFISATSVLPKDKTEALIVSLIVEPYSVMQGLFNQLEKNPKDKSESLEEFIEFLTVIYERKMIGLRSLLNIFNINELQLDLARILNFQDFCHIYIYPLKRFIEKSEDKSLAAKLMLTNFFLSESGQRAIKYYKENPSLDDQQIIRQFLVFCIVKSAFTKLSQELLEYAFPIKEKIVESINKISDKRLKQQCCEEILYPNSISYRYLFTYSYPMTGQINHSLKQQIELVAQTLQNQQNQENLPAAIDVIKRMAFGLPTVYTLPPADKLTNENCEEILTLLNSEQGSTSYFQNFLFNTTQQNCCIFISWLSDFAKHPAVGYDKILALFQHQSRIDKKNAMQYLYAKQNDHASFVRLLEWMDDEIKAEHLNLRSFKTLIYDTIIYINKAKTTKSKVIVKQITTTYDQLIKTLCLYSTFEGVELKKLKEFFPKRILLINAIFALPPKQQIACIELAINPDSVVHQYLFRDSMTKKKDKQAIFQRYFELKIHDLVSWIEMLNRYDIVMAPAFFEKHQFNEAPVDIQEKILTLVLSPSFLEKVLNHYQLETTRQFVEWFIGCKRHPEVSVTLNKETMSELHKIKIRQKRVDNTKSIQSKIAELGNIYKIQTLSWLKKPTTDCTTNPLSLSKDDWDSIMKMLQSNLHIAQKSGPAFYEWLVKFAKHPDANIDAMVDFLLTNIVGKSTNKYVSIITDMTCMADPRNKIVIDLLEYLFKHKKIEALCKIFTYKNPANNTELPLYAASYLSSHFSSILKLLLELTQYEIAHPMIRSILLSQGFNKCSFLGIAVNHGSTGTQQMLFDWLMQLLNMNIVTAELLDASINLSKEGVQQRIENNEACKNKFNALLALIESKKSQAINVETKIPPVNEAKEFPVPSIYPDLKDLHLPSRPAQHSLPIAPQSAAAMPFFGIPKLAPAIVAPAEPPIVPVIIPTETEEQRLVKAIRNLPSPPVHQLTTQTEQREEKVAILTFN